MDEKSLIKLAIKSREFAYAPYSGYCVGAALLAKDGRVFTGCNIENAALTPGICAERVALFKAVSQGCLEFSAIAVAGGRVGPPDPGADYAFPCGVCRQALSEFCEPDAFKVITAKSCDVFVVHTLNELLPFSFSKKNL